jgi:radical SAM superfamily enzyme YgiQ (UPF0313 family)
MHFVFINPNRRIVKNNIWGVINSVTPPIGLALLCAVLEKAGHDCSIVDAYADNLEVADIVRSVSAAADVVGLTATTPEIDGAIETARRVRLRYPEKKILMGGVHATVFHESLVAEGVCDMVVRGEAEKAIVLIADGAACAHVPNLTWRDAAGNVIVNAQDDGFVDLDELPLPAYHKLPMHRYRSSVGAAVRSPSIGMMTSRGCPGRCTFCYSGMFGSRIRFLSAEKVFDQIMHLQTHYGIREISFYDDTFTASLKRVEQLCRLLIENRADITWSCFARVDTVNPGILRLMKAAGCHQVMYGFETADEKILKAVNKRVGTAGYGDVVAWTRNAGIDIRGAFMLGSPEETEDSMKATIAYAGKIDIQYAIFNITTPYPGTALFDWAVEKGRLRHRRWVEYDLSHAILDLPALSPDLVEAYYQKAYRAFYLRGSYMLAHLLSIRTWDRLRIHFEASMEMLKNIVNVGK